MVFWGLETTIFIQKDIASCWWQLGQMHGHKQTYVASGYVNGLTLFMCAHNLYKEKIFFMKIPAGCRTPKGCRPELLPRRNDVVGQLNSGVSTPSDWCTTKSPPPHFIPTPFLFCCYEKGETITAQRINCNTDAILDCSFKILPLILSY